MSRLVILTGLAGVGKTTLARHLAHRTGALHLWIDGIETALARSTLAITQAEDAGYRAALAVAGEALNGGIDVIADCVNPDRMCRNWWRDLARQTGHDAVMIWLTCSDMARHRARVEERLATQPQAADWSRVRSRDYHPPQSYDWHVDLSALPSPEAAEQLICRLKSRPHPPL